MPTTKRIVVLANSVKHDPGRCIAGREVVQSSTGRPQAGHWVRPVSTVGEGELHQHHMRVTGGGAIGVLDIFDVSLASQANDPSQPENWLINAAVPWTRIGQWPLGQIVQLAEAPTDLWLQPAVRSDRTTADYIQAHPPQQSLYLIVPTQARLYRNERNRFRLSFSYGGTAYNLSVTDPQIQSRLAKDYGARTDVTLTAPAVCVSLAPAFQGCHYKLAATLIW